MCRPLKVSVSTSAHAVGMRPRYRARHARPRPELRWIRRGAAAALLASTPAALVAGGALALVPAAILAALLGVSVGLLLLAVRALRRATRRVEGIFAEELPAGSVSGTHGGRDNASFSSRRQAS